MPTAQRSLRRFCPCLNVRITADRAAADFLILHERQAGGTFGGNRNNIAVFGKDDLLAALLGIPLKSPDDEEND